MRLSTLPSWYGKRKWRMRPFSGARQAGLPYVEASPNAAYITVGAKSRCPVCTSDVLSGSASCDALCAGFTNMIGFVVCSGSSVPQW